MPRSMDAALASAFSSKRLYPLFLVDLPINNDTIHVWSGVGNFTWNGNTYLGVGSLGTITPATEGTDITAQGASISLSGVNKAYVNDALSDVQLGAVATIWMGALDPDTVTLIGQPVVMFRGLVDAPTVSIPATQSDDGTPATSTITIPLESRLATLGSGQQRKYSRADQNLKYPDDTAFNWVSLMNYLALKWQP